MQVESGAARATGGGPWSMADTDGFTSADLVLLEDAYWAGVARTAWGACRLVGTEFAHYLALFAAAPDPGPSPVMTVIRFRATGSYALMTRGAIVATGKSLRALIPAMVAGGTAARPD